MAALEKALPFMHQTGTQQHTVTYRIGLRSNTTGDTEMNKYLFRLRSNRQLLAEMAETVDDARAQLSAKHDDNQWFYLNDCLTLIAVWYENGEDWELDEPEWIVDKEEFDIRTDKDKRYEYIAEMHL